MSKKLEVWTDASSEVVQKEPITAIGYVIKHGKMPPLIGSEIRRGVYNSTGELMAGTECLSILKAYCEDLNIKTKNRKIVLRTDFRYLKEAIDTDSPLREVYRRLSDKIKRLCPQERIKFQKKLNILRELESLKSSFKDVICEEIEGSDNIAHNVGLIGLKGYLSQNSSQHSSYKENEKVRGLIPDFYELYEHPQNCEIRIHAS